EFVNDPLAHGLALVGFGPRLRTGGAVDLHFRGGGFVRGIIEYLVVPEGAVLAAVGVDHHRVHVFAAPGIGEAAQHEDVIGGPAALLVPGPGARLRPLPAQGLAVIHPMARGHVELMERALLRGRTLCDRRRREGRDQEQQEAWQEKATVHLRNLVSPISGRASIPRCNLSVTSVFYGTSFARDRSFPRWRKTRHDPLDSETPADHHRIPRHLGSPRGAQDLRQSTERPSGRPTDV